MSVRGEAKRHDGLPGHVEEGALPAAAGESGRRVRHPERVPARLLPGGGRRGRGCLGGHHSAVRSRVEGSVLYGAMLEALFVFTSRDWDGCRRVLHRDKTLSRCCVCIPVRQTHGAASPVCGVCVGFATRHDVLCVSPRGYKGVRRLLSYPFRSTCFVSYLAKSRCPFCVSENASVFTRQTIHHEGLVVVEDGSRRGV